MNRIKVIDFRIRKLSWIKKGSMSICEPLTKEEGKRDSAERCWRRRERWGRSEGQKAENQAGHEARNVGACTNGVWHLSKSQQSNHLQKHRNKLSPKVSRMGFVLFLAQWVSEQRSQLSLAVCRPLTSPTVNSDLWPLNL